MSKTLTTKQFIEKVIKIHGNKYDYSKVEYVSGRINIKIICPKHGIFFQYPSVHLRGSGCKKCNDGSSNTNEFINKSRKVHGNKYDYSRINYVNAKTKVEIICKKHGVFQQTPDKHLYDSNGCPSCFHVKLNTAEFIQKAIEIHGNRYNYSKVKYKNKTKEVEIVCSKHGSIWQKPINHLMGKGCKYCAGFLQSTTKEFVGKATKIHKNLYDYSRVNYVKSNIKVEIICKKHGIFCQTPNKHLNGHGCLKCSHFISKPETQWLDEQGVQERNRQYRIKIGDKRFKVDGYDPTTNTVYEFFGDYYHGNPKSKFKSNEMNKRVKKTFGELYQKTINKIKCLQKNGYNVKYIWESDFK